MEHQKAIARYTLDGAVLQCERYGSGHINETRLLVTDAPHLYILQRINHNVFTNVAALMNNIEAVTRHLSKKENDPRHVLTLVPTVDGASYVEVDGSYFRLYEFVTSSLCLDRAETLSDFRSSGVAFGAFQMHLSDFPAETLSETIPRFHDTVDRYAKLHAAIQADAKGRAEEVRPEIDFMLAREAEAGEMLRMRQQGILPLRVTHNDTKLNNVMLDRHTRAPLCVIDLDTVMPGLAGNDFGDSIRFGASTAAEDEKDLSRVSMSLAHFEAYAEGFLSACGKSLEQAEIDTLPMAAKLMTLECGVRFLTDYLAGDTYFRIARPEHNLDRCRTQIRLVADMEDKWKEMGNIISSCAHSLL